MNNSDTSVRYVCNNCAATKAGERCTDCTGFGCDCPCQRIGPRNRCKHGVPKDAIWACDKCHSEIFPTKRDEAVQRINDELIKLQNYCAHVEGHMSVIDASWTAKVIDGIRKQLQSIKELAEHEYAKGYQAGSRDAKHEQLREANHAS